MSPVGAVGVSVSVPWTSTVRISFGLFATAITVLWLLLLVGYWITSDQRGSAQQAHL